MHFREALQFIAMGAGIAVGASGCTSRTSIDDLAPRPSLEVTHSIAHTDPPAATPKEPTPEIALLAPESAPEIRNTPLSIEDIAGPEPSEAQKQGEPVLEAIALVTPSRPVPRQSPFARSELFEHRFRDAKPINFGKRAPKHLAVHGVDVSRWQGNINWEKLRGQGANFAWIKATDGGDHLDPMFRTNWRKAEAAGVPRGAYHFFYWCRTASSQADWFIRNVPKVDGALPPVIDVEWNGESRCRKRPSPENVREKMQVFMDRLERHYGQRPIIYTAPDFYRDNLKGAFPNHPFWLRAVAEHPSKVYPGRDWVFWQYSGSGLSHGVSGRIDLNVFHGSETEWRRWLGRAAG